MRSALLFLLSAALAFPAVEGVVQNQTTGRPQVGAVVTLVALGSGMNNLGSVRSDAEGKFRFEVDMQPGAPHLLQALHQGVTYNQMLPPGTPGAGLSVEVFDASANVPEARVTQDMILIERSGDELLVSETVIFSNSGNVTLQKPDGSLKVQLPPGVTGPVRMRITAPQGMPITREPSKGNQPNVWVANYPVKPGETRFDFSYSLPASGEATKFSGKVLHGGGPVRFVAPRGVTLESAALTNLGPEPRTQASVYELKGDTYSIDVTGAGELRAASAAAPEAQEGGEDNTPGIDLVKPRLYGRVEYVLALVFAMLAIGFVALYRAGAPGRG